MHKSTRQSYINLNLSIKPTLFGYVQYGRADAQRDNKKTDYLNGAIVLSLLMMLLLRFARGCVLCIHGWLSSPLATVVPSLLSAPVLPGSGCGWPHAGTFGGRRSSTPRRRQMMHGHRPAKTTLSLGHPPRAGSPQLEAGWTSSCGGGDPSHKTGRSKNISSVRGIMWCVCVDNEGSVRVASRPAQSDTTDIYM